MLVLASESPRRAQLLRQIGLPFTQSAVHIDETPLAQESPLHYVTRMAQQKAALGFTQQSRKSIVLAADTIVVINDQILGKPIDQADSARMLTLLSDNTHKVMTSVAVITASQQIIETVETQVCFGTLTHTQMADYWLSGEPQDKAGSYAIQGLGGQFVKEIKGSYSAVVGLPLYETNQILRELGGINER